MIPRLRIGTMNQSASDGSAGILAGEFLDQHPDTPVRLSALPVPLRGQEAKQ